MEKVTSQLTDAVKSITELGLGLIALGIIAEIVFGQGAIFGASIVANLSAIVTAIGGQNGFVGLVALILVFALIAQAYLTLVME